MTTAIQPTRPQGAPITQASPFWNSADEALVRSMCAAKATPEEWKLFLYMANLYRLDPLIRQIYCVKYGDKPASIFASRDGFLAIAQRDNRLNGIQTTCRVEPIPFTVTFWDNELKQHVDFTRPTQIVATSTAWGKGMDHPIVVEVWEEEYSTGRNLWVTKRRTMTAKVAECQALRRIAGISGLYDRDEMGNDAVRADITDVEAREVNEQTGEITTAPAKQAPRATERPATPSGVPSPASGQAAASAPRVVAAAGNAAAPTPGEMPAPLGDRKTQIRNRVLATVQADPYNWTRPEIVQALQTHARRDLQTANEAGAEDWAKLEAAIQRLGLEALPSVAAYAAAAAAGAA